MGGANFEAPELRDPPPPVDATQPFFRELARARTEKERKRTAGHSSAFPRGQSADSLIKSDGGQDIGPHAGKSDAQLAKMARASIEGRELGLLTGTAAERASQARSLVKRAGGVSAIERGRRVAQEEDHGSRGSSKAFKSGRSRARSLVGR